MRKLMCSVITVLVVFCMAAPAFAGKIKFPKTACYELNGEGSADQSLLILNSKPSGVKAKVAGTQFKFYTVQAMLSLAEAIDFPPAALDGTAYMYPDSSGYYGSFDGSYGAPIEEEVSIMAEFEAYESEEGTEMMVWMAIYGLDEDWVAYYPLELDCKTFEPLEEM